MTFGANQNRVRFSFTGSLRLARELWALADSIDGTRNKRSNDNATASREWLGHRRDDFARRSSTESTDMSGVAQRLRDEATMWATAWRDAMNEQNRRNRSIRVQVVRGQRSVGERIVDWAIGDDSDNEVAGVTEVGVPQPPHFSPTGSEQFL